MPQKTLDALALLEDACIMALHAIERGNEREASQILLDALQPRAHSDSRETGATSGAEAERPGRLASHHVRARESCWPSLQPAPPPL